MISLISDVHNIMRDSLMCKSTYASTGSVEHHTVFRNQNGRKSTGCVVLTVALVINPFHICQVAQLTISVAQCYQQCSSFSGWRHPSRSSSPRHPSHSSGSNHASQSSPSPPWPRPEFSLDLTRHANACFCPSPRRSGICLSNDVKRSDVCAFVPMSAQFSNVSTQLELFFATRFLYPQLFD